MSNPNPENADQTNPALSYKGSVSGLKGLLTNKLAEGFANVVSTIDRVSDLAARKGEGGTEKILIERIHPSPDQPRQVFDPKALEELSQTMLELGQAQAITVRRSAMGFEIISGERRYRAAKLAGLTELDCVVKECSPKEARLFALVENVQRQDLLPVEEAHYLRKVLDENSDLSLDRLAKLLGSHKSTLSEKIQLTEVPTELETHLYAKGKHLTHRHWRVISRIQDKTFLHEIFMRAVEHQLSVAELERALEAAGVGKAPRRNSANPEAKAATASSKALQAFRLEGTTLRLKTTQVDLNSLSVDEKSQLATQLESVITALRA